MALNSSSAVTALTKDKGLDTLSTDTPNALVSKSWSQQSRNRHGFFFFNHKGDNKAVASSVFVVVGSFFSFYFFFYF